MSTPNEALVELFGAHNIDSTLHGEWVVFPNRSMAARASIVREVKQQTGMSVQLDVQFQFAFGRIIVESFAGVGDTTDTAATDAFRNFVLNSFHVLLGAFFRPEEDHITQEEWRIGDKLRRVTVGNAGVRGKLPDPSEQLVDCFEKFQELITKRPLDLQTHWLRLYYGQSQRKTLACEVLLD